MLFQGGSFFVHEGMPYCETHYHAKRGSLCAGCHKPITGKNNSSGRALRGPPVLNDAVVLAVFLGNLSESGSCLIGAPSPVSRFLWLLTGGQR